MLKIRIILSVIARELRLDDTVVPNENTFLTLQDDVELIYGSGVCKQASLLRKILAVRERCRNLYTYPEIHAHGHNNFDL